jgi:3-hydroxyisobutyrate dehydrogenase-like beta-hydroxyacid dehydrogenase
VFASGDQEAIVRCDGIFNAFSHFVLNLGPDPAAACVMKVCANYIAATQIELMGEVYAFAEKSGLALDVVMAAFQTAYADPTLKMYAEKIKNRAFDSPGFDVDGGGKDVAIFQKAFADVGVSAGIAGVAMEKFTIARALGLGKKDWSATYEITRLMAGLDSAARPAR